jgi:hypothetical protein
VSRRGWVIVGVVAVVVVIAIAAGGILWATSSSSKSSAPLTHVQYAILYAKAIVKSSKDSATLPDWPRPQQTFMDGNHPGSTCYEWIDQPDAIYSLCFDKSGVLIDKAIG